MDRILMVQTSSRLAFMVIPLTYRIPMTKLFQSCQLVRCDRLSLAMRQMVISRSYFVKDSLPVDGSIGGILVLKYEEEDIFGQVGKCHPTACWHVGFPGG